MQAMITGVLGTELEMHLPFEEFLASGVMRQQALAHMCEPETVILDNFRENVDTDDDGELAQAFAEACELASDGEVWMVELDRDDLEFVRRRLCGCNGLRLLPVLSPPMTG